MRNRIAAATALVCISTSPLAAEPPTPPTANQSPPTVSVLARDAASASNAFGLDLYRSLAAAAPGKNLFLSPYSMSVALTMAAEGARGQTESEMARVLHFPPVESGRPVTPLHTGYAALAERFRSAAGSPDPATRKQIDALREQLDQTNRRTKQLESENKWDECRKEHEKAESLASQLNALFTKVDCFDLRIANALWVEQTFSLVPAYSSTLDQFYGTGGITPMNFAGDPDGSRRTINTWVEDQTEHRIKDLIPPGGITAATPLVLTNAVYFKGQWATPFSESNTREEDFTLSDGARIKARMMHDRWRGSVPYAAFTGEGEYFVTPTEVPADESQRPPVYPDDAGFQIIEIPYKGGDLSMILMAPRVPTGLPALEARLTEGNLNAWLAKLDRRSVDTAFPRFKLESTFEMSGPLKALGMTRALTNPAEPDGAQFPGISDSADPSRQVFIGSVLHKAWVEVTEKGTEAAAATAVMKAPGEAMRPPPKMVPFTPQFRGDRPFLFLIRDTSSGVILFIGRTASPTT